MISTRQLLGSLRAANPDRRVTEDLLRSALRRGAIQPPASFSGRFCWCDADVRRAAAALGLRPPGRARCATRTAP